MRKKNLNIVYYPDEDFLIIPEEFSQYCDLALSPFTNKKYKFLVKEMINLAWLHDQGIFDPSFKDESVDICYAAQRELLKMKKIDLSLDNISKKREIIPFPSLDEANDKFQVLDPFLAPRDR